MPGQLSGPGVGLQLPQNLYPTELGNSPYDFSTNRICLAPGQQNPIPRGDWYIGLGSYCVAQYLDPVTNTWVTTATGGWNGGVIFVQSDGFNWRVANLLGCVVGAAITNYGAGGYVQGSTTIAVTGSTATLQPIIGGQCTISGTFTVGIPTVGGGYGVAPIVYIPAPPPGQSNPNGVGGVQASGYASIQNGTVNGFTFTNPGAGYPTAPIPVVLPNPTDPNIASGITAASIVLALTGSGSVTGVLGTNPGAPLATISQVTLTVSGAGTQATVSPIVMQTVTAASVTGGGAGYGTVAALLTTVGGVPGQGSVSNGPDFLYLAWRPRPAQIGLIVTGAPTLGSIAAQTGAIYDGGLFLGTPTAILVGGGQTGTLGSIVGPTITLTMGSRPDIVTLQPALAS